MSANRRTPEIPLAAFALATAFVEGGCKHEEQEQLGEVGQLYLDFIDVLGDATEFYCECAVEAGYYESFDLCWRPAMPPPMTECIASVLDEFDDDAVTAYLLCAIKVRGEYVACMEDAGCKGDIYACYTMLLQLGDSCPAIPYAAERVTAKECYGMTLPEPFTCGDGIQFPNTVRCDGDKDCADGRDEFDCPSFVCGDGSEILLTKQCDTDPDCADFSDEQACPGQFTCGDGHGIPMSWQCDGAPDCADGSDEWSC